MRTWIKNNSVYPWEFHYPAVVLFGRWLEVVDFSQLSPDVPVGLLASHIILVVIPDSSLLGPFPFDFEHV